MRAIHAALGEKVPIEFFHALADSEEEAEAMYALHSNRVDSAKAEFDRSSELREDMMSG